MITLSIRDLAAEMLSELDAGWLEVCKIPTERGYIRVPISVNAEWYRSFCRLYKHKVRSHKKSRTFIKRCHTRRALIEIGSGRFRTEYARRLNDFIDQYYGTYHEKKTQAIEPRSLSPTHRSHQE